MYIYTFEYSWHGKRRETRVRAENDEEAARKFAGAWAGGEVPHAEVICKVEHKEYPPITPDFIR